MTGFVEPEVLAKTIPPLVQGGIKLLDFGKTKRELAAAREELVEKGKKIAAVEQELTASTMRVVFVTEELAQTREKLSVTEEEYNNYRDLMQIVMWSGGLVIVVLMLVAVLTSMKHA